MARYFYEKNVMLMGSTALSISGLIVLNELIFEGVKVNVAIGVGVS